MAELDLATSAGGPGGVRLRARATPPSASTTRLAAAAAEVFEVLAEHDRGRARDHGLDPDRRAVRGQLDALEAAVPRAQSASARQPALDGIAIDPNRGARHRRPPPSRRAGTPPPGRARACPPRRGSARSGRPRSERRARARPGAPRSARTPPGSSRRTGRQARRARRSAAACARSPRPSRAASAGRDRRARRIRRSCFQWPRIPLLRLRAGDKYGRPFTFARKRPPGLPARGPARASRARASRA